MHAEVRRYASRLSWELPAIVLFALALYGLGDHYLRFTVADALNIDSLHDMRAMGNPLRRVGYLLLAAAVLMARRLEPQGEGRFNFWVRFSAIFTVSWMALSVAWSDVTPLSLKDLGVALLVWVGCAGFVSRISIAGIRRAAVLYTGGVVLLGVVCELALSTFHPFSAGYRFSGTVYANIQGVFCAMLILGLWFTGDRHQPRTLWNKIALVLAGIALLLTQSRDSAISLAVAVLVVAASQWSSRRVALAIAGLCLVCSLALALFLSPIPELTPEGLVAAATLDRDRVAADGVGDTRLRLWQECLPLFASQPLTGYGYAAFWSEKRVDEMTDRLGFIPLHAHNGYLDSALNTGLVGCGAFVMLLFTALRVYYREYRRSLDRDCAYAVGVLTFFVTHLLFESYYITGVETILALCVAMKLAFAAPVAGRRERLVRESFPERQCRERFELIADLPAARVSCLPAGPGTPT